MTQFLFILPLLLIVPLVLSLLDKPLVVFPTKTRYTGYINNNTAVVHTLAHLDNALILEYTLADQDAYTGCYVKMEQDGRYADVSGYDYLVIHISSEVAQSVRLFLKTYVKGFTVPGDPGTIRHLEYALKLQKDTAVYRIPVRSFTTPQWWYDWQHTSKQIVGADAYSAVDNFAVHTGLVPVNQRDRLIIGYAAFYRSYTAFWLALATGVPVYYLVFLAVFMHYRRRHGSGAEKQLELPHQPLAITSNSTENKEKILKLIKENYADNEFSLDRVSRDSGISVKKITALIREKFDCTFRQLLNEIRITEARRLLLETDRTVTEIAYAVGYNNLTHFNRIFKALTGTPAGKFRTNR